MGLENKNIVCLGGGIGTVNLAKGLKKYSKNITIILSMADEGGSSGRLRRLYHLPPVGDLVSCMTALIPEGKELLAKTLTFRFPGDRYGQDELLAGHKLGNLVLFGMTKITGNFNEAIKMFQRTFCIPGEFLPATKEMVTISARTSEDKIIYGEESIDLGRYNGERILKQVYLHPKDAKTDNKVISALKNADLVIAGPGDLYTTILPVLIVPEIRLALKKSRSKKVFVVNIANKPFETRGYDVYDFIKAVTKHLAFFPFEVVIANNNYRLKIPKKYHYEYVRNNPKQIINNIKIVLEDMSDPAFPIYHNPEKLAKAINEIV